MYLCSDKPKPHSDHWAQERGIKVFHYRCEDETATVHARCLTCPRPRIDPTKDPSSPPTDPALYAAALSDLFDRRNLPILVHCNKGKHRVGTFCALLRRVQGYSLESVGAEWIKFIEEGAPPGSTGLWSPPGPEKGVLASKVEGAKNVGPRMGPDRVEEVKRGKDGRIKDKAHESRSRAREWSVRAPVPCFYSARG